ncbi:helix-turn-helix domain-containing protein [Novilysobacter spongiicola]|uniref:Transcriptional regulator, contains XRE-family HTH domain n=1 Tax=Lysobacter spongiicola DSM 21749 TaxID=1122188 RepID=A0A1T4RG31_9GAMM|nr:helix-turn-helix transcriptional regulator [Lysobacter spongiicola]SKA14903.1 Transcriptional regulator, contains XRE-family HTH domain [Lysobacter spongiicola DSM 21749]
MPSVLGEKIRARRTEMGLSLDDLAEATGSSKGYLWEIENRESPNPSADKLIKIAAALGLTVDFLLETNLAPPDEQILCQRRLKSDPLAPVIAD